MKNKLVIFQGQNIRRTWLNGEWYYSIIDVIKVLTNSTNPRNYWNMLKKREADYGADLYTFCVQLKLISADNKKYSTDCGNTKSLLRIIQSIPSKKAEPFKQWLAQLGHERIEEIENPELAQNRVKKYYEMKGYPKDWIDKRLRGIAVRQELTEEWKNRNVKEGKEFAILTNEITKATFDKTVQEYKEFKGLKKPNQNLRDNMTDWELILSMVGEKATTDITKAKDSKGLEECKTSAKEGGTIAQHTRKELESKIGKSLISDKNYKNLVPNKKKRLKQ